MGILKLIDAILFIFFLIITIATILFDSQTCLPSHLFPDVLIQAKSWYANEYGDYLVSEKPHFFVGLISLELLVQMPLSLANMYGILAKKSWYPTTCLIQGSSTATSMVAILAELIGSQKASDNLLMIYGPFLGFALLAVLRGLFPVPRKTTLTHAARSSVARKKRA
ncbi:Transmembrane protein 97 protein [Thalictrum thalictroides]|uniref:Transmembrane protein 97 protein n=1 Tax=Thalictrum thalictroides TaxID=46969 RepID=A0A7J6WBV0_THATH|nr:Transmembrane protein 97 protein [Thalictrum thalictroides]